MVIPGAQSPHMTSSSLAYPTVYDKTTTSTSNSSNSTTCNKHVSPFLLWSKDDENHTSVLQSDVKVDPVCTLSSEPLYEELREEHHQVPSYALPETLDECQFDHSIWLQTKDSIEKVKNEEYTEIQDSSKLITELSLTYMKQKRTFCNDMYQLNQELYHLLMQKESLRLQPLITMETIPIIVDHFKTHCTMSDSLTSTSQASMLSPPNCDSSTKPISNTKWLDNNQSNFAIERMNNAELEYKSILEELNLIKQLIDDYRNEVMLSQNQESSNDDSNILSYEKLLKMEDSWKNEIDDSTNTEKEL